LYRFSRKVVFGAKIKFETQKTIEPKDHKKEIQRDIRDNEQTELIQNSIHRNHVLNAFQCVQSILLQKKEWLQTQIDNTTTKGDLTYRLN
jgi:hypothetical protein